ncbi:MAG: NAD(P)/FAD-dependent oxidoreductase, partial [Spirochaetales bacterium]|nr:NAD(P)/FAD-dependent oxidoreductase [Candidatus Physcosoma equi]
LHELCGARCGIVTRLYKELGVDMDWIEVPDCFRTITVGSDGKKLDVTMPSGREAFISKMEEYVPGTRDKMERLFRLFDECNGGVDYFSSHPDYDLGYLFKNYSNFLVTGPHSAYTVFKSLDLPDKAIDILSVYWSYLGVDLRHLSFLHYVIMVDSYISGGAVIPCHTSHEMSQKLVEAFRRLGGDVWYNTRATEILFSDGKVSGVRTTQGDAETQCVLPNINEDIVYGSLIPTELVPERKKRTASARNRDYGGRMVTAYFCLDKTYEELGIKDYSVFFQSSADSTKEYNSMMKGFSSNYFAILLCYNVINPKASPEGTCICSFTTFTGREEWENLSGREYLEKKEQYAERFLEIAEKNYGVSLRGHIEEMTVATPLTFARYLGTPEGCVYGHETKDKDGIVARILSAEKDYPLKGLYPIGADGLQGDGYPAAYGTGEALALRALEEMKEVTHG